MTWIKKSITRTIGISILMFFLLLFLVYYNLLNIQFKNYFESQSKEHLIKDSKHLSTEIELFSQKYIIIVEQAIMNPSFIKITKEINDRHKKREHELYVQVTEQLKTIYNIDNNISLAYIALSNANDLITNNYSYDTLSNYDLQERKWYTKTLDEGNTTVTEPYLDLFSGNMIITISSPILDNEKVIGVFALDILIKDINTMMNNYKIDGNGYAVLMYDTGQLLYHPKYNTTSSEKPIFLEDLIGNASKKIISKKSGITSYNFQDKDNYIAFSSVGNTNLMVLTIIPKSEVFHPLNKFLFTNLFILIGLLVICAFFLNFLRNYISTPVVIISKQIETYSKGNKNITLPQKYLSREDEIGILSRGLTFMLNKISNYVLKIEEKNKELLAGKEEITYLSYHDHLTGLYNRRYFEEYLKIIDYENNFPISIAMIDTNGLKLTNDAFGHAVGDELLKRVAKLLQSHSRENDIVARIGGDEFVIVFPKTKNSEAKQIVESIYTSISHEKFKNNIISISIGFDTKTTPETPIENVLKKAEEHMYKKKVTESQTMRYKTIQLIFQNLNENNQMEKLHCERVSEISKTIGEKMNLDNKTIEELAFAGLMHDIGKIIIPQDILNKADKLTDLEYQEVKRHTESGYQILRSVDEYSSLAENVLYHHERWDGKGYPQGLKGKEIPLIARIISIADSYEAMTSNRPYSSSMTHEDSLQELLKNAGTQFDPEIVKIFLNEKIKL